MATKEFVGVRVEGVEDVLKSLGVFTDRESQNLLRSVNHGLASEIAKEMKKYIPVKSGNLRKSCRVKRRRSPPNAPVSEVVFSSSGGAGNNGYYWRFVDKGADAHKVGKSGNAHPGVTKPARFVEKALNYYVTRKDEIIIEQWKKKIVSKVKRDLKQRQRRK